jgi:hypothetical protein
LTRRGFSTPDVQRVNPHTRNAAAARSSLPSWDEVISTYPKRRLEVILNNLNTHKKNEAWRADDHCQANPCGPMMPLLSGAPALAI